MGAAAYAPQTITLQDAFRHMATRATRAPRATQVQVQAVALTSSYDIRTHSVITGARLNEELGGVLAGKGHKFIAEARKHGICPIFLAAVAMHESANGKSEFARHRNNVCGIFRNGKYHRFTSVDECIEFTARLLASRIYAKNPTIQGVQRIYCPVGAKNDPRGLNKYWLSGVMSKIEKLWGRTIYVSA